METQGNGTAEVHTGGKEHTDTGVGPAVRDRGHTLWSNTCPGATWRLLVTEGVDVVAKWWKQRHLLNTLITR